MKEVVSFDDVLLVPKVSSIMSRLAVNTSVTVGKLRLGIPIISSPMDTITEGEMATEIGRLGGLGIIHRFCHVDNQIEFLRQPIDAGVYAGFAVGIGPTEEDRFSKIYNELGDNLDVVCIDVANGHHMAMERAIDFIRNKAPKISIMAGNVATEEGYNFLADLGADSVRVGIGGGSICSTRIQTGFGAPTLTSIMWAAKSKRDDVSIIADGGIRYPSDITKSLAAGADAVICGNILAATAETPGEIIIKNNISYKRYRGMASEEVQKEIRGGLKPGTCAEGTSTLIQLKGPVKSILDNFIGGLASALTYNGSLDIRHLQENSEFIRITNSGIKESHSHGTIK